MLGRRWRIDAGAIGRAELGGQLVVVLAWIFPGARGNFRGKQAEDKAVLVCGPNRAVTF